MILQGTISFISDDSGGRTSDKIITEHAGFLEKIDAGDLILADCCFDVHDSIGIQQEKLKILAFTKGKNQLRSVDI